MSKRQRPRSAILSIFRISPSPRKPLSNETELSSAPVAKSLLLLGVLSTYVKNSLNADPMTWKLCLGYLDILSLKTATERTKSHRSILLSFRRE